VSADRTADLDRLVLLPEGPARTAALASWIQDLYDADPPVLVGGAAVELYCGGAYVTGDLDFAGNVSSAVAKRLLDAGFVQVGRHWVREAGQVFVEFPGSGLADGERAVAVQVEGVEVLVLSPEDVLVDRLAAWQFWRSPLDGVVSFRLVQSVVSQLDPQRLNEAAARRGVSRALDRLSEFVKAHVDSEPSSEKIEQWAKQPV